MQTAKIAPNFKVDDRLGNRYEHDWWYYFKKKYPLYPGIVNYRAGEWLDGYYSHFRAKQGPARHFGNFLTWAIFQSWLPFRTRSVARKYGLDKNWRAMALPIARRAFIDPNDIALFRIENVAQAKLHMRRFEHAGINRLINPKNWEAGCQLGNKLSFHNICRKYSLPHPEVHAVTKSGVTKIYNVPEDGMLAVKPTGGEGGKGFRLLSWQGGNGNRQTRFERQIDKCLGNAAGSWMVQERLQPHAALKPLAGSALLAARLITMINEKNEPELCMAALRFPPDSNSLVDNIKSGGMMAPIGLESGRLGRGCIGKGVGEVDKHPASRAEIEGLKVPFWELSVELAKQAHDQAFKDYSLIGWDVAITDKGPYLLEGNGKPCSILSQRSLRKGLGETRMGELMRYHIGQKLGAAR